MKCGHSIWQRTCERCQHWVFWESVCLRSKCTQQFGPPPLPIIETLDKNGDGQIDQDELAGAVASLKAR
ncbi:MAG: EF-hand domain-containing protein [Pirellulaceae bacterium]